MTSTTSLAPAFMSTSEELYLSHLFGCAGTLLARPPPTIAPSTPQPCRFSSFLQRLRVLAHLSPHPQQQRLPVGPARSSNQHLQLSSAAVRVPEHPAKKAALLDGLSMAMARQMVAALGSEAAAAALAWVPGTKPGTGGKGGKELGWTELAALMREIAERRVAAGLQVRLLCLEP